MYPKILKAVVLFMLMSLLGCSSVTSKVWKPYDKITIVADDSVNLDINERPSPVKIKIYQLSSRTTIDNLNFDRAFYQGKVLLSDQLLEELVFVLQPNEEFKLTLKPNKKTQFIAIVAAYRNIDDVKWKHVYKIKPTGHYRHPFVLSERGIVPGKAVEDKGKSKDEPADKPTRSTVDKAKSSADSAKEAPGKIQESSDAVQKAGDGVKGKVDGVMSPPDDIKQGVELINKKKMPNIKAPSF